jgi:hypothetical protein
MTELNENQLIDLFYEHLDVMKMGDAFATILEKFDNEEEQEQVFGDLLLPAAIVAFAEKYDNIDDDDGADIQNFFDAFCRFENISEDLGNVITASINDLTKDDDDVGVMSADAWDKLSNQERILKVKAFLKAIAATGDNFRDIKPFIKNGPGADPYGDEWGKDVKMFDRKANRYGATENPTTPTVLIAGLCTPG